MLTSLVILNLNITVRDTLKHCYETKIDGRGQEIVRRNYLAMKYLGLWSPGLQNCFFKTLRSPLLHT